MQRHDDAQDSADVDRAPGVAGGRLGPLGEVGHRAAAILDQAQRMADQLRSEAQSEVAQILRDHEAARIEADDLQVANAAARAELTSARQVTTELIAGA